MKNVKSKLVAVMVVVGLAVMLELAYAAQFYGGSITGGTSLNAVTNGLTTATNGTRVAVPQNVDLVIQPQVFCWAANTNGSPTVLGFNLSTDGTNWSSTYPVLVAVTNAGVNWSYGWSIITRTQLTGAQYIRWDSTSCANTSGAVILCRYGYFY